MLIIIINAKVLQAAVDEIEIDLDEVKESPADRSMDMSRIRGLGLFVESLPEPRVLFLGTVQLAP